MHVSYNQLKALARYTEGAVMAGPPAGASSNFSAPMVEGIQTGAFLTIQLIALAAAIGAGVPIEQAQKDFGIPDTIAARTRNTLAAVVQQVMAEGAKETAPETNAFMQPPPDPNSTETAGFRKFNNFMMALRHGVETAYHEIEHPDDSEALGLATEPERANFRGGMDFMIGAIAIALHDVTKRDIRVCAESLNIPEHVIADLEESMKEEVDG